MLEWLILGALAVWLVLALRSVLRRKGGCGACSGGCGSCGGCGGSCGACGGSCGACCGREKSAKKRGG